MENATQALFIAAGVLIGVMVISLGVYFFTSVSSVGDSLERNMSETQIQKFNTQFTMYDKQTMYIDRDLYRSDIPNQPMSQYSSTTYKDGYDYASNFNSISDVISAINKAYNINSKNNCDIQTGVQIAIENLPSYENQVYGITPFYQKEYSGNDNRKIYILSKNASLNGEKISSGTSPNINKAIDINEILKNYSDYKIKEGKTKINGDSVREYQYIFNGKTYINDETGLIDRIEFICITNQCYLK